MGPFKENCDNRSDSFEGKHDIDEVEELECKEFDDILSIIGPQGRYQKYLLYAAICPITALEPFITLNTIFLLAQPEHWCYIPGRDNVTEIESWKRIHIPLDFDRPFGPGGQAKYSQCTMYNSNDSIINCQFGWEYDKTEYESTIASAYDWVCASHENPTNAFTFGALGNAVGTLIFGHLADKVGRKPIFFLTVSINVFFRFCSFAVAHNVALFNLMQFLNGTAFPLIFIAPSMIVAETCDKDYRGWVYCLQWMIWVVGMGALPFVVMWAREWVLTGILTTCPGILLLLYWFYLPESPRWLFSVGKLNEAKQLLMKIAKFNGREKYLSGKQLEKTLKKLHSLQEKGGNSTGVWTLFRSKRLAKNTLLLTLCWSINEVVYYGLTLNTTHMSGNQFINFFLLSIIELPSGMMGAYLVDKFVISIFFRIFVKLNFWNRVGRRWTQVVFFCACTMTCATAALVVQNWHQPILEVFFVVLAKFAVTLTFLVVYLQGAEIFPTMLRSTGSGFASTIAACFGIFGPLIVALGSHSMGLPYIIMGILCFLGMISAAFLPETLNQRLPDSIKDATEFGKGNKFWSLYPNKMQVKLKEGTIATQNHPETNNHANYNVTKRELP